MNAFVAVRSSSTGTAESAGERMAAEQRQHSAEVHQTPPSPSETDQLTASHSTHDAFLTRAAAAAEHRSRSPLFFLKTLVSLTLNPFTDKNGGTSGDIVSADRPAAPIFGFDTRESECKYFTK